MFDQIYYWNVDSTIFWITDTFPLKYYGLLFIYGILLGFFIVRKIFIKENVAVSILADLLTYIIFGTILGARLGHCFFYEPAYYFENPIEILLPIKKIAGSFQFIGFRGLASHGGTIGVFIAIFIFYRKNKINLLWLLDRVAIGVPVAAAFIRLGNFMNSEIYGKPTNGKWGIVFQQDDSIPRHPTQLYEAFAYFLICGILLFMYQNKDFKNQKGLLFGTFLVLLFTARICIEFFKENQVDFENQMPLNMGQILSIPFVIAGLLLILFSRKKIS